MTHIDDRTRHVPAEAIGDLAGKAQLHSIIKRLHRRRLRVPFAKRRLETTPVYAINGQAEGKVWQCAPGSQFTFPAWSDTPFIRVIFRAEFRAASPHSGPRRFRIFTDCGAGFVVSGGHAYNVIGNTIDIDAVISLPSAALAFAIAPVDAPGELSLTDFRLYALSRPRARVELLLRRLKMRSELAKLERRRRARIRASVREFRRRMKFERFTPPVPQEPQRNVWRRALRYAPHLWGVYQTSGSRGASAMLFRRFKRKPPPAVRIAPPASVFRRQLAPISSIAAARSRGPFISILMPVFNTPADVLDAAIQSVLAQTWPNWELCICDDCSTLTDTATVLDRYRGADWRIKIIRSPANLHISGATNAAAEFATGEFVGFLDHDDVLEPSALEEIATRVIAEPEIDLLYTDEDKIEPDGSMSEPYLKPDWSPEHLESVMYLLHFLVVRKSLFLELGGLRSEYSGAQDYDLALRASRKARVIAHIPRVLYHWRKIAGSAAARVDAKPQALLNGRLALTDHVRAIDPNATVEDGLLVGTHRVRWPISATEPVTLLILTAPAWREVEGRGKILLVENFIDSILAKSTFRGFKLLVVASNPLPQTLVAKIAGAGGRVVSYRYEGDFNYSSKVNFALDHVETEDVILLNDDLEVISADWIEALLEQSRRPEIGAVGARLLFASGQVQHAGIVLGVNGSAAHVFHGLGAGEYGCHAMTHIVRNYSAVTAAVLATRMSVLREIGMFDPALRIDFNDVEACLKIREAGYRIVYTPYAELYHFEGQTLRRVLQDDHDTTIFLARWKQKLAADPYYNPCLPKDRTDCHIESWLVDERIARIDRDAVRQNFDRQMRTAIAQTSSSCRLDPAGTGNCFYRMKAEILAAGLFDAGFYIGQYSDVAAANMDPLDHFLLYGARENRRPNASFDPKFYRDHNLGGCSDETNPLLHYIRGGEERGFSPSSGFDPIAYAAKHPDIAASGVSPLWHYLVSADAPASDRAISVSKMAAMSRVEVSANSPRHWTRPPGHTLGVNFIGPTEIVSGLGVSARGYLRALEAGGVPTHVVDWRAGFEHQAKVRRPALKTSVSSPQPINLIHLNADILDFAMPRLRELVTPERYNIGIWYWELASFRPDWMQWIDRLDEIWCSSEFAARAIRANSRGPVRVVRPAIEPRGRKTDAFTRKDVGLTPKAYVFYYNFDVGSGLHRKNPAALIEAFLAEFGPSDNVQLLLKMHYSRTDSDEARRLVDRARLADNVVVIDETLSDDEMRSLWSLVDCYVSPHRSEGLGLTVIEAMLAGRPVIATAYGGVADFLDPKTGYPIDFERVEIAKTIEPYPAGFIWAEPCIASLRRALREAFQNCEQARVLAERGRARVNELFALEVAGRRLAEEIRRIWQGSSAQTEFEAMPGAPVRESPLARGHEHFHFQFETESHSEQR